MVVGVMVAVYVYVWWGDGAVELLSYVGYDGSQLGKSMEKQKTGRRLTRVIEAHGISCRRDSGKARTSGNREITYPTPAYMSWSAPPLLSARHSNL